MGTGEVNDCGGITLADLKGITIELGLSDISVMKLRAIGKHAEALANELDEIDKKVKCPYCGSHNTDRHCHETVVAHCNKCKVDIAEDELPTRLEGSE